MSLLPKNNVNLPPLLVNGEPKILNKKMTVVSAFNFSKQNGVKFKLFCYILERHAYLLN